MGLIERRIGLLFAVFLVLLVLAVAARRAGRPRQRRRRSERGHHPAGLDVAAPRPARVDHRPQGNELAVSEPADDVCATPYLVKDPVGRPRKLAPILGVAEAPARKLAERSGFVYLSRSCPAAPRRSASSTSPASTSRPASSASTRATGWPSQVLGTVGTDGRGPRGPGVRARQDLHGTDGERRIVQRRPRRADLDQGHEPAQPGARHRADARRGDPGQGRGGPPGRRPGRTGRRARPRS